MKTLAPVWHQDMATPVPVCPGQPIMNDPLTLCWAAVFGNENRQIVKELRNAGVLVFFCPQRVEVESTDVTHVQVANPANH